MSQSLRIALLLDQVLRYSPEWKQLTADLAENDRQQAEFHKEEKIKFPQIVEWNDNSE